MTWKIRSVKLVKHKYLTTKLKSQDSNWKQREKEMEEKNKVLVIGATGRIGYHLARSSIEHGHPTFALIRDSASINPIREQKIEHLSNAGATLLKGSLEDEKSLLEAVKQVDVVICSLPNRQAFDQKNLIRVIKEAGCIKRFIPSEYEADPDKNRLSGLDSNFYARRTEIRHLIRAEGIPYTFICCNFFMSLLLPSLVQLDRTTPPRDKVTIYGDGNTRGVFVKDTDVADFTINALDDPRTLNKVLHLRPPGCVYSMNELVETWESKIGKKLERIYVPEEELVKKIKDIPFPKNKEYIFLYSAFVKGDQTYFDMESAGELDGTKLYPHLKYTTISEYLDTLV